MPRHESQSNSHCLLVIGMSNTGQNRLFDFLPRPDHPAAPLQQNVHLGVGYEWLGLLVNPHQIKGRIIQFLFHDCSELI